MLRIHKLLLAAVFLVGALCAARAYGQGGATGAISGLVIDTSGAAVGEARVRLALAAVKRAVIGQRRDSGEIVDPEPPLALPAPAAVAPPPVICPPLWFVKLVICDPLPALYTPAPPVAPPLTEEAAPPVIMPLLVSVVIVFEL